MCQQQYEVNMPRILIAATSSGSGKTTIVCGLLNALKKRGLKVTCLKCGPDYIDPMFHQNVLGISSGNLDSFFMDANTLLEVLKNHGEKTEVAVMEGVMGYYDGIGFTESGSSAEVANITDTPVVLVIPCWGMSNSIGAVLKGFLEYHPNPKIKGVIFNQLPECLYEGIKAVAEGMGVKSLGYLPYNKEIALESRHLGLLMPDEIENFRRRMDKIAELMEKTVDIDAIYELAKQASGIPYKPLKVESTGMLSNGQRVRIGIAKDSAFCFLYRDNVILLEKMGCEIIYFSPLEDEKLPENIQAVILSGGYPELYAKKLSANKQMLNELSGVVRSGMPCIAECGGFMYLHETLVTKEKKEYPMVGVIKGKCYYGNGMKRFGYVTVTAEKDYLLSKKADVLRAHEFHYYESEKDGQDLHIEKAGSDKVWRTAYADKNSYMGYPHFYFYGNVNAAYRFVNAAKEYYEEAVKWQKI